MRDTLVFPSTSEEAVEVYQALRDSLEAAGLQTRTHVPPETKDLGSAPLKEVRSYFLILHKPLISVLFTQHDLMSLGFVALSDVYGATSNWFKLRSQNVLIPAVNCLTS